MEITSIESFIKYFENIRKRTIKVVSCIPKEKVNWSPKKGRMTFGDIIRHLALAERYIFVEIVKNNVNIYPGFDQDGPRDYDDVLTFLEEKHKESMAILHSMEDFELLKKINSPDGVPITAWKWLRAMVEHEVHHRGTIYSNLALLDIKTPPIFGLEEKEVRNVK